jgi:uncharacterized membrane protein
MNRRKRMFFVIGPLAIVAIAAFIVIGSALVMYLWNWLLPPLFGWRIITLWQAFGLLVLCRILFGSHNWRGSSRTNVRERMRERMSDRWQHMTPEQREKMRKRWAFACGFEPPAEEANPSNPSNP